MLYVNKVYITLVRHRIKTVPARGLRGVNKVYICKPCLHDRHEIFCFSIRQHPGVTFPDIMSAIIAHMTIVHFQCLPFLFHSVFNIKMELVHETMIDGSEQDTAECQKRNTRVDRIDTGE
jgi:hypothetical protein